MPPAPAPAPEVSEEQGQANVEAVLGGRLVTEEDGEGKVRPCEECGNPVDDEDIAVLSQSRFKRWLCVSDYIAETKRPHAVA